MQIINNQNSSYSSRVNSTSSTQLTNNSNTTNSFETLIENEKNSNITKEYLIKMKWSKV